MDYKKSRVRVLRDGVDIYVTDNDGSNRPWFGKTWGPADVAGDEIAAATVWDKPGGKTSRWSIIPA